MSETPKTSRAPRAVAASLALALGATGAITAGSVAVADDAAANTVTVRAGDGWWVLAQRAGMSQSALAAANGMTTNTLLHPGMTLRT
ncbi:MAG: LysM domain-containing protein, partial [Micrococcus sp.]|nr:LysM domain-containing protein [Micrococcus sp.]